MSDTNFGDSRPDASIHQAEADPGASSTTSEPDVTNPNGPRLSDPEAPQQPPAIEIKQGTGPVRERDPSTAKA